MSQKIWLGLKFHQSNYCMKIHEITTQHVSSLYQDSTKMRGILP